MREPVKWNFKRCDKMSNSHSCSKILFRSSNLENSRFQKCEDIFKTNIKDLCIENES